MHGIKPSDLTSPSIVLVSWILSHMNKHPGTGSARAMQSVLRTLALDASMGHVSGSLDTFNAEKMSRFLKDNKAMYLACRMHFNYESLAEALESWDRTRNVRKGILCSCTCTCG